MGKSPEPTAKTILNRWMSLDNAVLDDLHYGRISQADFLVERTSLAIGTLKATLERLVKLEDQKRLEKGVEGA